jgi:hypothetical protein
MGVIRVLALRDIRERLAIGVTDFQSTRYRRDGPWWNLRSLIAGYHPLSSFSLAIVVSSIANSLRRVICLADQIQHYRRDKAGRCRFPRRC